MNSLGRHCLAFLFILACTCAAVAQTRPTPSPRPATPTTATAKKPVAVIFSSAFDVPERGIKKMIDAKKTIEGLFKADLDALSALYGKIQTIERDAAALQEQLRKPNLPAAEITRIQNVLAAKQNEFDALGREHNFKRDQLRAAYDAKQKEILGPIIIEVGRAVSEYAKARGYAVIFDGSRLQETGMMVGLDETVNVTADFIAFFNAKSVTPTAK